MNGGNIYLVLFLGVLSGLATGLIVIILDLFWKKVIRPWWENFVYKDATIEGIWEAKIPELNEKEQGKDEEYTERITLKRQGHRVYGEISCVAGIDKHKKYSFEGSFFNSILTATYSIIDRRLLDRGSFSIRLAANGEMFEGYSSYYYTPENKINTLRYEWIRIE